MTVNAGNSIINGFAPDSKTYPVLKQTGFIPAHLSGNLLALWLEQEPESDGDYRFEACDEGDCGY